MFRKKLTKEVYPELNLYLREREFSVVAHNLQCRWEDCIPALGLRSPPNVKSKRFLLCMLLFANEHFHSIGFYPDAIKNLIRGRTAKIVHKKQSDVIWQNKVWQDIKAVCHNEEILKMLNASNNTGSEKLYTSIFGSSVSTLTGRVRGYVTFTQACNTPFSGFLGVGLFLLKI